jgi:hypothetical protein
VQVWRNRGAEVRLFGAAIWVRMDRRNAREMGRGPESRHRLARDPSRKPSDHSIGKSNELGFAPSCGAVLYLDTRLNPQLHMLNRLGEAGRVMGESPGIYRSPFCLHRSS